MLRNILEKLNIEYFGAVPVSLCRPANLRLYESIPKDAFAVFMLFPYYIENTAEGLAKFAAVPDYHVFAKDVFARCEKYLTEKYPDKYVKGFADHSPLAECDGACRAGLGILGRHSMLICENYSSFVCIGELVCSLSREELIFEGIPFGDGSIKNCEGCGKCMKNCPSQCCGSTDRSVCLSQITQKKQPLSETETVLVHSSGYTWGCDRCAFSCPHSRSVSETPIDFFHNGAIIGDARRVIEQMDAAEFANYPFSWRKKEIIMRNFNIIEGGNNG